VPGVKTVISTHAKSFTIGETTAQDVAITFVPGTRVVDAVNQVGYTILPSGEKDFFPLYDRATGKITDPHFTTPASLTLAANTRPFSNPEVGEISKGLGSSTGVPQSDSSRTRWLIVIGISLVTCLFCFFKIHRTKGKKQKSL
jgi:hypothetical protein